MNTHLPCARQEELLVQRLVTDVLIYDLRSKQAHCLNAAAAAVWEACDGNTPVDVLASKASEKLGASCDTDAVWEALDLLQKRDLLKSAPVEAPPKISRRDLVFAAVLLPIITTIAAPTPAMAGSLGLGHQGPQL